METKIELFVEIPEYLHGVLQSLIEDSDRCQNDIIVGALTLYALQNGKLDESQQKATSFGYLNHVFGTDVSPKVAA